MQPRLQDGSGTSSQNFTRTCTGSACVTDADPVPQLGASSCGAVPLANEASWLFPAASGVTDTVVMAPHPVFATAGGLALAGSWPQTKKPTSDVPQPAVVMDTPD